MNHGIQNTDDGRRTTGFTLIELITVIIIIGIMLGVALPKYMQMAEKTKAVNAKRVLDGIRKAEEEYFLENGDYTDESGDLNYAPDGDNDWEYHIVTGTAGVFLIEAERKGGRAKDKTISLNNDGVFSYNDVAGSSLNTCTIENCGMWGQQNPGEKGEKGEACIANQECKSGECKGKVCTVAATVAS